MKLISFTTFAFFLVVLVMGAFFWGILSPPQAHATLSTFSITATTRSAGPEFVDITGTANNIDPDQNITYHVDCNIDDGGSYDNDSGTRTFPPSTNSYTYRCKYNGGGSDFIAKVWASQSPNPPSVFCPEENPPSGPDSSDCTVEDDTDKFDAEPPLPPPTCGDGDIDPGEECDGGLLEGNDCTTIGFGFNGGTLSCSSSCTFNINQCTSGGSSVLIPGKAKVFLTSSRRSGNLDGIAGADNICLINAPGGDRTEVWKAYISTKNEKRISIASRIYFKIIKADDGTFSSRLVSNGAPGDALQSRIDRDQFGDEIPGSFRTWTGLDTDRDHGNKNCRDWTYGGDSSLGAVGRANRVNEEWRAGDGDDNSKCNAVRRLYCFQQTVEPAETVTPPEVLLAGVTVISVDTDISNPNITVDTANNDTPLLSYQKGDADIWVAKCVDNDCTFSDITFSEIERGFAGTLGEENGVAVVNGKPIVVYRDDTSDSLRIAFCQNNDCSSIVATSGSALGTPPNIIGIEELVVAPFGSTEVTIAYRLNPPGKYNDRLQYARCDLSTGNCYIGNPGISTNDAHKISLFNGKVVFRDDNNKLIYFPCYASCANYSSPQILEQNVSIGATAIIDSNSSPLIIYSRWIDFPTIRFAYKSNFGFVKHELRDSATSITVAIANDTFPIVAYERSGRIRIAKCGDAACDPSNLGFAIYDFPGTGTQPSIAIGSDDLPIIAYNDGGELKIAKCINFDCSPPPPPIPDFNTSLNPPEILDPSNIFVDQTIYFINLSQDSISYEWDFDYDGVTFTIDSTDENPSTTYDSPGTYQVKLIASSALQSASIIKSVNVYDFVVAGFDVNPPIADPPLIVPVSSTVIFKNESRNAETYVWDFGDGSVDTRTNPSHVYDSSGLYTVTLTASNPLDSGTETKVGYIRVYDLPTVSIWVDDNNNVYTDAEAATLTWDVSNVESCNASGDWEGNKDASDGPHNELQPAFGEPEVYTYNIECVNAYGVVVNGSVIVEVFSPTNADFDISLNPSSAVEPVEATFTDQSSAGVDIWRWDFDTSIDSDGDSDPANDADYIGGGILSPSPPSQTYDSAGTYTVGLVVENSSFALGDLRGSASTIKTIVVRADQPPTISSLSVIPSNPGDKEKINFKAWAADDRVQTINGPLSLTIRVFANGSPVGSSDDCSGSNSPVSCEVLNLGPFSARTVLEYTVTATDYRDQSTSKTGSVIVGAIGGIVSCGRDTDDPTTVGDESQPCGICHTFSLISNILNKLVWPLGPSIAALMLAVGGFMFFIGGAKPTLLVQARGIMTAAIVGLIIIFVAWLGIHFVLDFFGVASWTGLGSWWVITC